MLSKNFNLKAVTQVKTMVILALLAALSVVLELFLGINSGNFKLHFGYLPVGLAGMLYGIFPAALVSFVADILSNLRNFSLPFAILAVFEGAVYGVFLNKKLSDKKQMFWQAFWCQLVISLIIHAGLNTLLLWKLYGYFDPIRFLINAITFPIKVYTLYLMLGYRSVFEKYA